MLLHHGLKGNGRNDDQAPKVKAIQWFKKYADKDLSVTDCTSFVIMNANDIEFFAGFDDDFKQMSFISIIPQLQR